MIVAAESFTLEYAFEIDRTETLSLNEVVGVYFDFLATTSIKADVARGMLPLWLEGYRRGDFRLQEAAFGPLRTEGISFVWPWFIECLDHFRDAHLLPLAWHSFSDQVKDRRLGFRQERVPLLADTLFWTIQNYRLARQHAASSSALPRTRQRTYVYGLESECEASQSLASDRLSRLIPGDWQTYPPFFPGDRTRVSRNVS